MAAKNANTGNADLYIVVGADRIKTASIIASDLKAVINEISDDENRRPRVVVGAANTKQATIQMSRDLKAILSNINKDPKQQFKLNVSVGSLDFDSVDISPLVKKIESALKNIKISSIQFSGGIGSSEGTGAARATNSDRSELREAVQATMDNYLKIRTDVMSLFDQQSIYDGQALADAFHKYFELYKDAFTWSEKLNASDLKFVEQQRKKLNELALYKNALQDLRKIFYGETEEVGKGGKVSIVSSGVDYKLIEGTLRNNRGTRVPSVNVSPVTYEPSYATDDIKDASAALQAEQVIIKQSNSALDQHESKMRDAAEAEALKASQSQQTAEAIKQETAVTEQSNKALESHAANIRKLKGGSTAADIEAIKKLAETQLGEGYEIRSVTVDKTIIDNDADNIARLVGSVTEYNRATGESITQTFEAKKAMDDEEATLSELILTHQRYNQTFRQSADSRTPQQWRDYAEAQINALNQRIASYKLINRDDVVNGSAADWIDGKRIVQSKDDYNQLALAIRTVKANLDAMSQSAKSNRSLDSLVVLGDRLKALPTDLAKAKQNLDRLSSSTVKIGDETVDLNQRYVDLETRLKSLQKIGLSNFGSDNLRELRSLSNEISLLQSQISLEQKNENLLRSATTPESYALQYRDLVAKFEQVENRYNSLLTQAPELVKDYEDVRAAVRGIAAEWDNTAESVDRLTATKHRVQTLNTEVAAHRTGSIEQIQDFIDSLGKYDTQIANSRSKLSALGDAGIGSDAAARLSDFESALKNSRDEIERFRNASNDSEIKEFGNQVLMSSRKVEQLSKATRQAFSSLSASQTAEKSITTVTNKLRALVNTMTNYIASNGKIRTDAGLSTRFDEVLEEARAHLNGSIQLNDADYNRLREQFGAIQTDAKNLGISGETGFQRLNNQVQKLATYLSGATLLFGAINQIKTMITNVIELDSAMTELKKVTDETDVVYEQFLTNAVSRAKSLGAALSDVVSATADFARLGYDIADSAALADAAIVYKNVGDGIESIDDASTSIISTMKAFGVEAEDVMTIVDRFNEVDNRFSISSKGIGDALLRSASSLATAGNTLDESIALITAMNEVVQDPDVVGTSLKTISSRLRTTKGDLEELGEDADGAAESITALQTKLLNLTHGRVNIFESDNVTFKSTYDIMQELASVWDEMNDLEQASVTELIGQVRQANTFSSLMNNMSTAAQVVETSMNSTGSALAENDKYLESIRGHMNLLAASTESFSNTIIDSDLLKNGIDGLRTIIDLMNEIASFSTSGFVGMAAGGILSTTGFNLIDFDKLQTLLTNEKSNTKGNFWDSLLRSSFLGIGQTKSDIGVVENVIKQLEDLSKIKGDSQFSDHLDKITLSLMENVNVSEEARTSINKYLTDLGNTRNINKATAGLKSYHQRLSSVGSVAKQIGAQILNVGAQMAVGFAIGTAIDLAVQGINYLATANERAIETSKELTSAWKEQADVLSEAQDFVRQYGQELELLSRGISEHGENLSLTDDQYQRYIDLSAEALSYFPSLETMYTAQGELILATRDAQAALNDELEREQQIQRAQISVDIPDVYKGVYKQYMSADWLSASDSRKRQLFQDLLSTDDIESYLRQQDPTGTGILLPLWIREIFADLQIEAPWSGINIKGQANILRDNLSAIRDALDTFDAEIDISPIQQAIDSIIDANDEFSKLSPELQNNIRSVFQNLDISFYTERWNANEGRQLYNDLRDNYIAPLSEFQDEISTILNPDTSLGTEDYAKRLREAFNTLPVELQDVFKSVYDDASLGFGWKRDLADKLQQEIHSITDNQYSVEDVKIILSPDFEIKEGQSVEDALAEYRNITVDGGAIEDITEAINSYNKSLEELNRLYIEQRENQTLSNETYNNLLKNNVELAGLLEAQYDELTGTVEGWTLSADAAANYADELRDVAMETLIASGATAEQISQLQAYKGALDDAEERIVKIASANETLAELFVRAANAEQFAYSEVVELTSAYPELIFQFDELTGKYNLYPESVDKIIDANYAQIQSLQKTRLEWIKLKAELDFEAAGVGTGTVNTIIKNIERNGVTSLADYMETNELSNITGHAKRLVEAYTSYLNDMADADTQYAAIKEALISDAQTAWEEQNSQTDSSPDEEEVNQYELNRSQLDREKKALDSRVELQKEYVVYGIKNDRDYYETLRQIALDGYRAQELDAENFKDVMLEIQIGLREATVAEYQKQEDILTTEKRKLQAGMVYDQSVISSLADFWDKYEDLSRTRYEQNIIDATEFADAMIEVFEGRQDELLSVFSRIDDQISLWQNQDEDSIYGYVNRDKIVDAYEEQMRLAHQYAEEYRDVMKNAGIADEEIENSDYIKELSGIWWDANNARKEALQDAYEEGMNAYEDYISHHNSMAMWGADSEIAAWQRASDFLEQSYQQGLIDYRMYLNERLDLLESQYAAEQDRQQAYINAVLDQLDREKEALEERREEYEKQKSDYETVVSTVTDFIQEQIDALNKENEELNRQLNLQKAIEAVERARSQRTNRIYREGVGFVWEADNEAVKDAEEELDDLEREYALQDRIDALEAYKKAWQDTIDSYEDNINREIVASKLGADWEQYLLDMRTDYLDDFASEYADIRNQLDEEFEGSVASQIAAVDEMSNAWNSMYDEINDELNSYVDLNEYIAEFEKMSYEERLAALAEFKASSVANLQAIRDAAAAASRELASLGSVNVGASQSSVDYSSLSSAEQNIISSMKDYSEKWWSATSDEEKKSLHNSNKLLANALESYGTKLEYEEASGIWYVIKNGQRFRAYASGGLSTEQGLAMLHGSKSAPEVILNNSDASKLWQFVQSSLPQRAEFENNIGRRTQSISIGDIILHGVQDVNGLSKAIVERLPLKVLQLINR